MMEEVIVNMDTSMIIFTILFLVFESILFLLLKIISIYLTEKNALKALDVQNKKIELFMQMDSKEAEKEINEHIKQYMDRYVLENFIVNGEDFIRKEDIEIMIKELDRQIVLELSELYIFYIKMLVEISSEDDIIAFIHRKTKEIVLEFVTNFNKDKE